MEQKTKKETSRKRKIVALICSIALCMLLVSVSVYAAVSQTAKVTNTISVTRSGQSYVAVTVKKATSSASTAYTLAKGADVGTYNDLLTVDASLWKAELDGIKEFYAKIGDTLPEELKNQLSNLEKRLG